MRMTADRLRNRGGAGGTLAQGLMCGHGVPFVLGCHLVVFLKVASWLLPASWLRWVACVFAVAWPVAISVVMLCSVATGLVANHHLHLPFEPVPWHAGADTPGSPLRRRRPHWPPAVHVPAQLQEHADAAPRHLLCPITHHIMTQPAVTVTGATYEREAIVEWLSKTR